MNNGMNERWLCWILSGILFFLAVIAVELSALTGPFETRAQAQIPDSGLQRMQLLESQAISNATLNRILEHLRTQTIKVKVVGTDKDIKPVSKPAQKAPEK